MSEGSPRHEHEFTFIVGLQRSGTSVLFRMIREHPELSSLTDTGVFVDEGQFLIKDFIPCREKGIGAPDFIRHPNAYLNEQHPKATEEIGDKIFDVFSPYWDMTKNKHIEKSPLTTHRTRFFQKLFPKSRFLITIRHPLFVAFALQKWSKARFPTILDNVVFGYERLMKDLSHLNSAFVIHYEDLIRNPKSVMEQAWDFIGVEPLNVYDQLKKGQNEKYLKQHNRLRNNPLKGIPYRLLMAKMEPRLSALGYSLKDLDHVGESPCFGHFEKGVRVGEPTKAN